VTPLHRLRTWLETAGQNDVMPFFRRDVEEIVHEVDELKSTLATDRKLWNLSASDADLERERADAAEAQLAAMGRQPMPLETRETIEMLRRYPQFYRNGVAWIAGDSPNPLCNKAADLMIDLLDQRGTLAMWHDEDGDHWTPLGNVVRRLEQKR
jgi:hypothetical protein